MLRPVGLADAVDLKAAQRYTYALRSNGTIALWGANDNLVLNAPENLTNVVAISAGYYMPMALTADGQVHVWGASGHVLQETIITPPASATNVTAIAGGMDHCLALRADGTVVAWGNDLFQQTQVPEGLSNVVHIAAGQAYSMALKNDGTIVAWGNHNHNGSIPPSATNVVMLAAGVFGHTLALRADGTVVAWSGSPRPEAIVPPGLTNVIAIAAGTQHSIALRADGTLVAWGDNQHGQAAVPTGFVKARAIAAGARHNAVISSAPLVDLAGESYQWHTAGDAVTLQGTVACPEPFTAQWLKDGVPLAVTNTSITLSNVQQGDAGTYVLSASNTFGSSISRGIHIDVSDSSPRWITQPQHQAVLPGSTAQFTASAKGSEPLFFQWRRGGQPIADATNSSLTISPVTLSDEGVYTVTISNVHGSITSAPVHLAATLPVLLAQPSNLRARTNWVVSLDSDVLSPTAVTYEWFKDGAKLANQSGPRLIFDSLQADDAGSYVLRVSNAAGTVTNGPISVTMLESSVEQAPPGIIVDFGNPPFTGPFVLDGVTNAVAIAAGNAHTVALLNDGSIKVLGDPQNLDLLNVPPSVTNAARVYAGPTYSAVLRENGTAVLWGTYTGPHEFGLTNVVDLATSAYHQLLLLADGTVVRSSGASVPQNVTNIIDVAATSEFSFALRADGQVLKWNDWNSSPGGPLADVISGLDNVVELAGGQSWVSYALRADGRAVSLGQNGDWAFVQGVTNAISIASGGNFAALLESGDVFWGKNAPPGLKADRIAASQTRVIALTSAPYFNTQPQSQLLYSGIDTWLTVDARSSTPLSIQWYRNNEPLPGGTNATLLLAAPRPSDSGIYHVAAQNAVAQTVSTNAVITVTGPPELLGVSGDRDLLAGDPLELQAEFASHPSPTFLWRFNGLPIPNATNAILLLPNSTEQMTGAYSVTLSNIHGFASSNGIQVVIMPSAPRIVSEPQAPPAVPDGSDVDLHVQAAGSLPLSIQWMFNNEPITGQTQPLLRLSSVSEVSDGTYRAIVTNMYGAITSAPVVITTTRSAPAPEILSGTTLVREGKTLRLEAAARGTSGIGMQWMFNGGDLPGETNSVLLLESATLNHGGKYAVRAGNAYGTNESAAIQVRVLRNPGSGLIRSWGLLPQPASVELVESARAGFNHGVALRPDGTVYAWGNNSFQQLNVPAGLTNAVEVAAGQNFSLALRSDGTVIGWGRNDAGQCLPPQGLNQVIAIAAGVSHALALKSDGSVVAWGNIAYRVVPTNLPPAVFIAAGPNSSVAVATNGAVRVWGTSPALNNVPAFITNTVAVAPSMNLAYALDASGVARVWPSAAGTLQDGTNLTMIAAGAGHAAGLRTDGRIVTWGNASLAQVRDPRTASNVVSIAAGDQTTLAIIGEPRIISRPPNQVIKESAPVTLTVGALGTPPLSYRWKLAGSPISDATNATLHIAAFNSSHAGLYSVEVSNRFATATTNFSMTLGQPPIITMEPADQIVRLGSNATFSVQSSGTATLRYQWALNGTNLLGATTPSLTLTNVLFQDQGYVSVVVSNIFGTKQSRHAALRIAPPALTLAGAPGSLRLQVSGLFPNRNHTLLASSNLVDWIPVEILTGGGTLEIEVPTDNLPARFYMLDPLIQK